MLIARPIRRSSVKIVPLMKSRTVELDLLGHGASPAAVAVAIVQRDPDVTHCDLDLVDLVTVDGGAPTSGVTPTSADTSDTSRLYDGAGWRTPRRVFCDRPRRLGEEDGAVRLELEAGRTSAPAGSPSRPILIALRPLAPRGAQR